MAGSLELEAVRERLRYDTPFWARNCATILDESRQPVRLVARPWQARTPETPAHIVPLDEALEKQRAAGLPMRALILKSRKLGFSTWVQAKAMQRVTQLPFQYALSVAQDRKTSGVLMDMARLIYDRLPTEEELGLGFAIKPQMIGQGQTRSGSRWMSLGDRRRPTEASIYETMTAGSKATGRGYTPSIMHLSEVAHYEDPLIGLLNSVPKLEETIIVKESTANGFNHFHGDWQRAVDGVEDPDTGGLYVPLFYGWQDNPFNAMPFTSPEARDRFERTVGDPAGGGDPEEIWLVEQFGVTLEQLRWRRLTVSEDCDGKIEIFHQEHPATAEQAFIGSGHPVFSAILVARALKHAEESHEPVEGVLRGLDVESRKTRSGTIEVPRRALWVPRGEESAVDFDKWGRTHRLRVWEHPVNAVSQEGVPEPERKPDGQYVVFVDVARGRDATSEDRDYNAIQVLDHVTRLQVASYRSRIPIHDLPYLCLLVATYYNEAWLAVEATGLGIGVVDALQKDFRYRLMYRRRRRGDDERGDSRERMIGWETTLASKPLMEQTMGQALKDGSHGLRCRQTGRELTTYIEDEKGHHAQKGAHDDLLMAFMGAHRVAAELRPRDPGKVRSARRRTVHDDLLGY